MDSCFLNLEPGLMSPAECGKLDFHFMQGDGMLEARFPGGFASVYEDGSDGSFWFSLYDGNQQFTQKCDSLYHALDAANKAATLLLKTSPDSCL
jgi:hypothetical protein